MAPNDLTPCRMAFYFVSTFAIAQTPTKQPALRLSRTKNLHFAKAPFPGFSAEAEALADKNERIQFQYEWLSRDIEHIKSAIQEHINAPRIQPRSFTPIDSNYRL